MAANGHSQTTAANALAARRRAFAVELRSMRRTYQQIADATLPCSEHRDRGGIDPDTCRLMHENDRDRHPVDCARMYASRSAAKRAVEQGLAELYPIAESDRDAMRREWLSTLDTATQRLMRDLLSAAEPVDRARAANAVARLSERVAKLAGLDAPTRLTVTDELDEQIAAALEQLNDTPVPTLSTLTE